MKEFEDVVQPITPEIAKLLTDGSKILDEGLRYGVYLYEIIYESNHSRTRVADMVLGLMFREVLEVVDGINILLKSSCVVASKPLVRTLLELYAQMKLIIEGNSENNARAYMVCHIHLQIDTFQKPDNEGVSEKEEDAEIIKNLLKVLHSSEYKEIDSRWIKLYKKKGYHPNWYNIIEKPRKSINALLEAINDDETCRIVYGYLSMSAHGFTAFNKLEVVGDQYEMTQLRHPNSFASTTNFAMILLCDIYHCLIERYLSKEDEEKFTEWFEERMVLCNELAAYEKSYLKY
ncbi:DUF5677 domain-containing protein [Pelosinus propionicus]|uniref:Uncharacterized protein n=1 Tax=Pelosinus propionicus DSM 13327 TaxID=1123291 RepID=A0A1I4JH95_9FIRM|nr:DUF5677 domain-containing protein [Pelosinus propionicus]SFL65932.1 hypothetical protein SAMN04490355_101287 [Pelosinus propionicus DSM 13327]